MLRVPYYGFSKTGTTKPRQAGISAILILVFPLTDNRGGARVAAIATSWSQYA
jgi:hypothetical protein